VIQVCRYVMAGRFELTDAQWDLLAPLLPADPARGGRWKDHRTVISGILFRERTGVVWRDLPERFGNWKTVYQRKRKWALDGTWERILDGLRTDCDLDEGKDWTLGVDSMAARAHQHAAGARRDLPVDMPVRKRGDRYRTNRTIVRRSAGPGAG
jgi:transposase